MLPQTIVYSAEMAHSVSMGFLQIDTVLKRKCNGFLRGSPVKVIVKTFLFLRCVLLFNLFCKSEIQYLFY